MAKPHTYCGNDLRFIERSCIKGWVKNVVTMEALFVIDLTVREGIVQGGFEPEKSKEEGNCDKCRSEQ